MLMLNDLASIERFQLEELCRARAQSAYLGDHTAVCRLLGRYKLYLDTRDRGFGSHVLLDGFWETWLTVFIARHVRPGMAAIDVGANFGYYTLLLADLVGPSGRVWAFEPNPATAAFLRNSVTLNGFAPRTTVVEAAAGAEHDAVSTLFVPHGEPKNASVVTSADPMDPTHGSTVSVRQVALDHLAGEFARLDFVKIDAEGAEEAIIEGMSETLSCHRPSLVLEFNAARYRDPRGFLAKLAMFYNRLQFIDYFGDAVDTTDVQVTTEKVGEDWLLYFEGAGAKEFSPTEPAEQRK